MNAERIEEAIAEADRVWDQHRATAGPQLESLAIALDVLKTRIAEMQSSEALLDCLSSVEARIGLVQRARAEVRLRGSLSVDPDALSHALTSAESIYERVRRNFDDIAPRECDLELLRDQIDRLTELRARLVAVAGADHEALGTIDIRLWQYREHLTSIQTEQSRGSHDDRANLYARLANRQFAVYAAFFANQSRCTRRPERLERIAAELERLGTAMRGIACSPASAEANRKSIEIVTARREVYLREAELIREARSTLSTDDLAAALRGEADPVAESFRTATAGHPALHDLVAIGTCIDRIDELRLQLEDIFSRAPSDAMLTHLAHVRRLQTSYIEAHVRAKEAQKFTEDTSLGGLDAPIANPTLHARYARGAAIAMLGLRDAVARCDGELVLGEGEAVILATAGKRTGTHFSAANKLRFRLRGDRDGLAGHAWARSGAHVFVRLPGESTYLYVGTGMDREPGLEWLELELSERIPREAWSRFGAGQWVVSIDHAVHDFDGDQLDAVERALDEAALRPRVHVEVTRYEGDILRAFVTESGAWVGYRQGDGAEVAVRNAAGLASGGAPTVFACGCGTWFEAPPSQVIARDEAFAAAKSFVRTGKVSHLAFEDVADPSALPDPAVAGGVWVERFRRGDLRAVWREMVRYGNAIRDPEPAREAEAIARETMRRARHDIDILIHRLRLRGYVFASAHPRAEPTDADRAAIAELEALAGPLPFSLRASFEILGAVDFSQSHAQHRSDLDVHRHAPSLSMLGSLSPLMIPGPCHLLTEVQRTPKRAYRDVVFCPDDCLKGGFSGDYFMMSLPSPNADFDILCCGESVETFIEHLRACIRWGGFRGHQCHLAGARVDHAGYEQPCRDLLEPITRGLLPI